jgi:hypothetical protein
MAQTINLKGQLLQDTKVIRNYTVIIDGHPATTNDAGIFQAPISAATKQVKVQPSDQKYVIVYPQGGRVLVPKDASLVTEIVVAAFKSNDYLKEYLNVSKQIKDSVGKSSGEIKLLHGQLDSIIKVLHKLSYTDTDLRSAKEIQEGKDRNLFDITKDLEDYSRNLQNLLSAFKYVSDYAFTNNKAINQLSEAVLNYNQVYDRLDGKKIFYQKAIADYWGKDEADSFQHVISFAMDTIHASRIYPLRDLLKQINDYFNTTKKNNDLKLSIQKKIADAVAEDEVLIERLKNEITAFSQSLAT